MFMHNKRLQHSGPSPYPTTDVDFGTTPGAERTQNDDMGETANIQ